MLTAPPEPDHAEIVVRYLPAAEAARVGGDWYDAFVQPDGATVLVIGDVVGHDTSAAASMGQLRSMLRGIAVTGDVGPAGLLAQLDTAMTQLQLHTYATAALARFEQTPDDLARGITRMRWANAGHPPPLIIHPDGTVAELATWRGDLMLGVDPTARRSESVVSLDRGTTVLLYTDGLIERRDSRPRRRDGPAARPPRAELAGLGRWTSCATGSSSGWSTATRRTTSRWWPSGCTARTAPGPTSPGPGTCPRRCRPTPP